jgi:hypothetical protein
MLNPERLEVVSAFIELSLALEKTDQKLRLELHG